MNVATGVQARGIDVDVHPQEEEILTPEALDFVAELTQRFERRRRHLLGARLAVSMSSVRSLHAKSLSRYVALLFGIGAAAALVRAPIAFMSEDRASFDSTLTASLSQVVVAAALGAAGIGLVALVQKELLLRFHEAQSRVKVLSGLLPICANCKRIRDDEGTWIQMETYVRVRSEADFSHGVCPECCEELYPDLGLLG